MNDRTECHVIQLHSGHTFIPFFAAINKTSLDILKFSIFEQSVSGLVCQMETPIKGQVILK